MPSSGEAEELPAWRLKTEEFTCSIAKNKIPQGYLCIPAALFIPFVSPALFFIFSMGLITFTEFILILSYVKRETRHCIQMSHSAEKHSFNHRSAGSLRMMKGKSDVVHNGSITPHLYWLLLHTSQHPITQFIPLPTVNLNFFFFYFFFVFFCQDAFVYCFFKFLFLRTTLYITWDHTWICYALLCYVVSGHIKSCGWVSRFSGIL